MPHNTDRAVKHARRRGPALIKDPGGKSKNRHVSYGEFATRFTPCGPQKRSGRLP